MEKESSNQKALTASLGYTLGNIFVKGFSFLTIPIFSNILSVSDYGVYSIYGSYLSILVVMIGCAIHVSVKNAKYDFPDRLDQYNSSVSLIPTVNMLFLLVAVLLFSSPLAKAMTLDRRLLWILVVDATAHAIITFYNSVISLDYRYKEYLGLSLLYAVGGAVTAIILIKLFPEDRYFGRILGPMAFSVGSAVYIMARLFYKAKPKVDRTFWKYSLKISLPIVPHGLSQLILSQFDRIMINNIHGSNDAGIYSFAHNIGMVYQVVSNSLDTAWTPWFFERMVKKEEKEIRRVANIYALVLAAGAILLMLVSPELIYLMGGKKYLPSRIVVMPIVLAMFYSAMYCFPASIEYYYKKTTYISAGTIIAAILNISLNSIFIPIYGFVAAAYTTVACYLAYYTVHLLLAKKIHGNIIYSMKVHLGCVIVVTAVSFSLLGMIDMVMLRLVTAAVILLIIAVAFILYKTGRFQQTQK